MVIENMQQTIELLKNIKDFFFNIDETEKRLNTELYNKEGERDDLLHEIELSKLNAIERMQTYSKLETDTTIKNIETLKSNQENRQYTPRIIKDLKCAKKKKE